VINQSITTGNFSTLFALAPGGSNVYSSSCKAAKSTFTQSSNNATVTVTFKAPTAGTYFIDLSFGTSAVTNQTAPSPSTVGYSFSTAGVPSSTSSFNLIKK
jgi:hypothetical protein